jgi:FkbM family methyltransferase
VFLKHDYFPSGFNIQEGDIVVDMGSHRGVFVAYAQKAGASRVYAFEPDQENYSELKELIANNFFKNVTANNFAIAKQTGKTKMMKSSKSTRNSLVLDKDEFTKEAEYQEVKSLNINEALKDIKKVDFLKMDIEGAEYEVIESCSKKTFNKIHKLVLEYHLFNGKSPSVLKDRLSEFYSEVVIDEPRNAQFGYIYCKSTLV